MTSIEENQASNNLILKKICAALKGSQNIEILTHKSPDGDTLGSAFALSRALIIMGKNVEVLNNDGIPETYSYLIKEKKLDGKADLIVAVDIATPTLLGDKLYSYKDKIDICIDHHLSNEYYAKVSLVDSESSAACEVIFDLIKKLGVKIDPLIANCIYTGIATDTGCFRYSNTTGRTHRIAADLSDLGADTAKLNKLLFETITKERLQLEKLAMATIELSYEGKIATMLISNEMFDISKAKESETEGIASFPSRIKGVEVGITFKERENNSFKISMRSSGNVNVSDVCKKLGGGGHSCAAGATVQGNFEEVKEQVLNILKSFI